MAYRKLRHKAAGERPVWAARKVDAKLTQVQPLPGWVLLHENSLEVVRESGIIVTNSDRNTTHAVVLAIHEDTKAEIGVSVGDTIIFKEWSGGRWSFEGVPTLLTSSKDILGVIK